MRNFHNCEHYIFDSVSLSFRASPSKRTRDDRDERREREREREREKDQERGRGRDGDRDRRPRPGSRYTSNDRANDRRDDDRYGRRREEKEKERRKDEPSNSAAKKEDVANDQPPKKETTGRTGGVYIPPFKLALMQKELKDPSSVEYQKMTWEALKKSLVIESLGKGCFGQVDRIYIHACGTILCIEKNSDNPINRTTNFK